MDFAFCFLFILVMTHALNALPFPEPGYYSHHSERGPNFKNILIPETIPVSFPKKISTSSKSHFKTGHPLWHVPHISKHAMAPPAVKPLLVMPKSKGKHFYGNLPRGKPLHNLFSPYSFFKSGFIPESSFIPFPLQVPDTTAPNGIPKTFEINLPNSKPKILFVKEVSVEPFPHQKQFIAEEIGGAPNKVTGEGGPEPNSNNNILAINIVKTENETPPLNPEPVTSIDYFNVIDVPIGEPAKPNDAHTNVITHNPFVDNVIPNEPVSIDSLTVDTKAPPTDKPVPDVNGNAIVDSIAVDINIPNPDVTVIPKTSNVGVPFESTNTEAVFIGDIPGFVIDGGSAPGTISDQTYVIPDTLQGNQVLDVLNINGALINKPRNGAEVMASDIGSGLNLNGNTQLLTPSGTSIDFNAGGLSNLQEVGNNEDFTSAGVRGDVVIPGNKGTGLQVSLVTDIQNGQTAFGSIGSDADVVISKANPNGVNLNAEIIPSAAGFDNKAIIPDVNTIDARVEDVSGSDDDVNSPNVRSVVIVRPGSFLMNIEPFGPGPYGQCRAPARVVCGVRFGWEHVTGMAEWCQRNCVVFMYSSYCDDNRCQCECT